MTGRPLLLLLGTGSLVGLTFPLGKLAMAAGVGPAIWAAVISIGAGLMVSAIAGLGDGGMLTDRSVLRFALFSALVSYVIPNLLTFTAIPRIGSGLTAIMFALSPVVTALLSTLLRVRPPRLLGMIGIGVGLIGARVIISGREAIAEVGGGAWVLAALFLPVSLAIGNVHRTLAWPAGASPRRLAAVTNLAAVPPLLVAALLLDGRIDIAPLASLPVLVAVQGAVSTAMFLMFFRLQQIGGPTYLSQIGYVGAAVGLLIGVTFLGETYPARVWAGAGLIAIGIALSTFAQFRNP